MQQSQSPNLSLTKWRWGCNWWSAIRPVFIFLLMFHLGLAVIVAVLQLGGCTYRHGLTVSKNGETKRVETTHNIWSRESTITVTDLD